MMNGVSKHIIKEAVLDFRYNGNTDGFAFQHEVKEWFDKFYPALEQTLNRLPVRDEVISIDKLEIEVELDVSDWRELATEKISWQLQDKLELLSTGTVRQKGFQKRKLDQRVGDMFLFYLKNGYLSWEASGSFSSQWDEKLRNMIAVADKEYVTALKDTLRHSYSAVQRFSQIIPFPSAVHLFSILWKDNAEAERQLIHDSELIMKYAEVNRLNRLKQLGYQVFLQRVIAGADLPGIEEEALASLKNNTIANPHLTEAIRSFGFQSELFRKIQTEIEDAVRSKLSQEDKPEAALPGTVKDREPFVTDKMMKDGVYISDAGLVLVAAFLPALFEKTALSESNQVADFNRAVCLTRFLATGSEHMQEYELPLAKILCGVDPGTAIDAEGFRLTAAMKTETDAVLSSVIEYWSILQNTSVAGLRESFLRRNGKLDYDGKDWLLRVEQESYDMLIQHLPWNFSMIRLPWMNCLLKTEWVY